MSKKLDIACGTRCAPGFEGVDISPCHPDVKHVVNILEYPWPWSDGSVDAIRVSHFIEHVPMGYWTPLRAHGKNPGVNELRGADTNQERGTLSTFQMDHRSIDLLMKFFDECWRVLRPEGTLLVECPQVHNHRAWQDPTHRRFIVPETFQYFSAERRKEMGLEHGPYGVRCDFAIKVEHTFDDAPPKEIEMLMRSQNGRRIVQERDRERWNVTKDLRVTLVKIPAPEASSPSPSKAHPPASEAATEEGALDRQIAESNARAADEEAAASVKRAADSAIRAREMDVARTDHEVVTEEEPHLFRAAFAPGGMVVFDGNMRFPGHQPREPEVRAFPDPTPEELAAPMPSLGKGASS